MQFSMILVRVFVSDLARSIEFYSDKVGLRITNRIDEMGWAELDTGACKLALERIDPDAPRDGGEESVDSLVGRFAGLSLAVDDVYASYEDLRARGVDFLAPPEPMPWGGVLAHFRDPDANVLTLVGTPQAESQAA
jgi:catechol 2,3-dioxygenase-like lactoylglutathione lyase family enzyme